MDPRPLVDGIPMALNPTQCRYLPRLFKKDGIHLPVYLIATVYMVQMSSPNAGLCEKVM